MATGAVASLYMVNLDCADPRGMAGFYSALLGWETPFCEDDYSMVSNGSTSSGSVESTATPHRPGRMSSTPSSATSISASRIPSRPRPRLWNWAPRCQNFSPAVTVGGCSWTLRTARSASFPLQPSPERGAPMPRSARLPNVRSRTPAGQASDDPTAWRRRPMASTVSVQRRAGTICDGR